MVNRKKKGQSGEAKRYITRNAAVRKLQLSLADFRKLCILKGIYPREPKSRKKAQKGSSEIKTLYLVKDIQFLLHEPIIWKFREHRSCMNKVKKAYARNEQEKGGSLYNKRPLYRLDHIVRERYPTFTDALRDLDDPLTLCNLFAKLPLLSMLKYGMLEMCRRLTVEFMLYVIEARALRKVFISIKGYYYQAEIMGQTITWITPHPFTPQNATGVDYRIMKTFVEFYMSLLGFVNYRLYTSLNLHYPPRLPGADLSAWSKGAQDRDHRADAVEMSQHRLASLNVSLQRNMVDDEIEDKIDTHLLEEEGQQLQAAREEEQKKKRQQNLFTGFKFFLNRETNLESLTFVIKSCGGQVSWDTLTSAGSAYPEEDESITHQIVDRPKFVKKYLSRYYVQPQWVYDCINARLLLPVQDYFLGASLPPHLSPFDLENDLYVPPEKQQLIARQEGKVPEDQLQKPEDDSDTDEENTQVKKPKRSAKQKALDKMKRRKERAIQRAKEQAEAEAQQEKEAQKKAEEGAEENEKSSTPESVEEEEVKMDDDAKEPKGSNEKETNIKEKPEEMEVERSAESSKETDTQGEKAKKGKGEKIKEPVEMEVSKGKLPQHQVKKLQQQDREEHRLTIMMIPRKRKRIYNMLRRREKWQEKRAARLKYRRSVIDAKEKEEKKVLKKQQS